MSRLDRAFYRTINRHVEWHRLPTPLAILNLKSLRDELREENLHDGYAPGERQQRPVPVLSRFRTADGSGCDAADADMGSAGTRFGHNAPAAMTAPREVPGTPSPREVSRRLLARDTFKPATSLNVLAAAWIQFQNHDWFSHGPNEVGDPIEIPLAADDDWPDRPMCVRRTHQGDKPGTFVNTQTHWWDGSMLYGSTQERCDALRTGEDGKLAVSGDLLPEETDPGLHGIDLTGFNDNYWTGLALMHTLFAKEHNAICDYLRGHYPTWGDERLFQTARLVNAALMAKIHTIEWTPGILATPALRRSMRTNWYGLLGERFRRRFGRIGNGEVLSGIPGSPVEHHAAPFSVTEEFASVYRLHPLIPDEYRIHDHRSGAHRATTDFTALQGHGTRPALQEYGLADLYYSFGVAHPGAITLHNHPTGLGNLQRIEGDRVDVGTIDVLRDRERGVPRYNDFREMMHKSRVRRFEDLTPNPAWAAEIRDVYEGRIDDIDLAVGLCAEPAPKGFGFSDTAFRVFILMASRRLKSDRFLSYDFRPEVYTPEGMEWVDRYGMLDVLRRHHPELAPALEGVGNAFAPWQRAGDPAGSSSATPTHIPLQGCQGKPVTTNGQAR